MFNFMTFVFSYSCIARITIGWSPATARRQLKGRQPPQLMKMPIVSARALPRYAGGPRRPFQCVEMF